MVEITENVKRAWAKKWTSDNREKGYRGPSITSEKFDVWTRDAKRDNTPAPLESLGEALNLLHFAAERAGLTWRFHWGSRDEHSVAIYGTREVTIAGNRLVEEGQRLGSWYWGVSEAWQTQVESPLDAVLKAVDAIVAHKPEAFA